MDIMGTSGLTHREDFRRMTEPERTEAVAKRERTVAAREGDGTFGQHLSEHTPAVAAQTEALA